MVAKVGRRGFGAAVVAGALAGCMGAMGRERELITAARKSPPAERSREVELEPGDRIILEYRSSGEEPSRLVIEGPNGEVLQDDTLTGHETARFEANQAGTHTARIEWGDSAKITLYVES